MQTEIHTSRRPWRRLETIVPEVAQRVRAAEFTSQQDICRAYGVGKATVARWKEYAFNMSIMDPRDWLTFMHVAKLRAFA